VVVVVAFRKGRRAGSGRDWSKVEVYAFISF